MVYENNPRADHIPKGLLILLIQKGLHYIEIETHMDDQGIQRVCNQPFSVLEPHICQTLETTPKHDKRRRRLERPVMYKDIEAPQVTVLDRHTEEVFACKWNPVKPLLATASADGCSILWNMDHLQNPLVLDHRNQQETKMDITTMDWNRSGSLLATGNYGGVAYIWSDDGYLKHKLEGHREPVFVVKWNKKGNYLLTGSFDSTVVVWDSAAGESKQVFGVHSGPILDVDWKSNTVFASCSGDGTIQVCKVYEKRPLHMFSGHSKDVNVVKWDPSASYLASGSDDCVVKLWELGNQQALHTFAEHQEPIYCIDWSPSGPKSRNPNSEVCLASASDKIVKIWSLETGTCHHTLSKHQDCIYAMEYSPDAQFIATGSVDKTVNVWSARDGSLVRTFDAGASVYGISWNGDGNRLGVCSQNNYLHVVDLRL